MLSAGTIVYPSEVGHYNFFYADTTKRILLKTDIIATKLVFISGKEMCDNKKLTAYKVKDIISETDKSIVIWVWE